MERYWNDVRRQPQYSGNSLPHYTIPKIISAEKAVEANATLHREKETSKVLLQCRT